MRFTKFYVALGAFFALLGASLADGAVSGQEFSALITSAVGAVLVFALPNASKEAVDEVAAEITGQVLPGYSVTADIPAGAVVIAKDGNGGYVGQ